uniref:Exosome complex component CSL4-like n=1 Tax=Phallusia mammillata TaxID=59560 RepID=A0A6F9DC77_9ASCI|nr:exosome complex component CSL4-like [Phallusia mammillata]
MSRCSFKAWDLLMLLFVTLLLFCFAFISMEHILGQKCIPGERLTSVESCRSGTGTYQRQGYIFASLTGVVCKEEKETDLPILYVASRHKAQSVPEVGNIVTCKITQISSRFAKCQITAVNNCSLAHAFRGMIRKEDVRSTERDKVEIFKSFHPGDIVLAKVLSLGDAQWYLLTTAENELGVVVAQSENGTPLTALSHNEMQCPVTHVKESRKVARPQKEHIGFPER